MAWLIYKEFYLNRKSLFGICVSCLMLFGMIIFFSVTMKDSDLSDNMDAAAMLFSTVFGFFIFITVSMFFSGIFEVDESKKWADFISSTPVSVRGQVAVKYIFTLLCYLLLAFFYRLVFSVGSDITNGEAVYIAPEGFVWIFLFLHAIEYPFMVRWGSKTGSAVKTAVVLVITLAVIEYALFGNIEMFRDTNKFWSAILDLGDITKTEDTVLVIFAVFPYISALCYFISYKISCGLYLKGAETYAK